MIIASMDDESKIGVLVADQSQQILSVNAAFSHITGFTTEDILSNPLSVLLQRLSGRTDGIHSHTVSLRDQTGQETHMAVIVQTNTHKKLDAKIRHLAFHDQLTDLPNRVCLHDCVDEIFNTARANGQLAAVMFLDLDRFKSINDTLGHAAGDLLLMEMAKRIQSCLGEEDRVARMGGDEFICVVSGLTNHSEAKQIAQKIIDRLAEPFLFQEQELFVTTSIGISLYPYHGNDLETLITTADTAMYHAKHEGRNGYRMFTYEMNVMSMEKMLLEQSLRNAIMNNELCLYYQPLFNVQSNQLVGLEALVRWQHPESGLILPAEFIPIAEETDLIVQLGNWILKEACAQNKKWQDDGLPPIKVSVNVSARQFQHPEFIRQVTEVFQQTQLDPKWLELEITETVFIHDVEQTVEKLNQLRKLGVSIAVDDFGAGYSSLIYLRQFPLDVVKIDRTFIRDIAYNTND